VKQQTLTPEIDPFDPYSLPHEHRLVWGEPCACETLPAADRPCVACCGDMVVARFKRERGAEA